MRFPPQIHSLRTLPTNGKRTGTAFAAVVLLLAAMGWAGWQLVREPGPERHLVLTLTTDTPSRAQVYHAAGGGFREENSSVIPLLELNESKELAFPLPARRLTALRFDPLMRSGTVVIHQASIRDHRKTDLLAIPLDRFSSGGDPTQIVSLERTEDGLRMTTSPTAGDPVLMLDLSPDELDLRHSLSDLVSRFAVYTLTRWFLLTTAALLAGGLLLLILRRSPGRGSENGDPLSRLSTRLSPRWRNTLLCLAAFLIIFGANLWYVEHYGSDVPYMDQWDGEARDILIPWLEGDLSWRSFLSPHNEHRIVFTRLLALGLFITTGQWDNQVQTVVTALLPSLLGTLLIGVCLFSVGTRDRLRSFFFFFAVGIFALPFGWENILVGFQSQFYFLCIFSFMAILGLGHRFGPAHPMWWVGLFGALAALLTVASGLLAALTVLALLGLRFVRGGWRLEILFRKWATILAAGVAVIAGVLLQVDVEWHKVYRAPSVEHFLLSAMRHLSWPQHVYFGLLPLMWFPFAMFLFSWLRGRLEDRLASTQVLGLGVWVILQCLAIGYSRGGGDPYPIPRYLDIMVTGVFCQIGSLYLLANTRDPLIAKFTAYRPLVILYLVFLTIGLAYQGIRPLAVDMPRFAQQGRERAIHSAAYVLSGDMVHLDNKPFLHIPHLHSGVVAEHLDNPILRPHLPTSIREPVRWELLREEDERHFRRGGSLAVPSPALPYWSSVHPDGPWTEMVLLARLTKEERFSHLRMNLASDLGASPRHISMLVLYDPESGEKMVWQPPKRGLQSWQSHDFPAPGTEYLLAAFAYSGQGGWMAFTPPRELSGTVIAVESLMGWNLAFFIGGVLLALFALNPNLPFVWRDGEESVAG